MSISTRRDRRLVELAQARWRAELNVCAALAGGPRQGFALLRELGVGLDYLFEDDSRCIYVALEWAGDPHGPPRSKSEIARVAAGVLQLSHLWDQDDTRRWVCSSRWSPASLSVLLTGVKYDPDVLRGAVLDLLAIESEERDLCREVR